MIADAAKGWLDVDTVRLRYRVEREGEQDADLLMYNPAEKRDDRPTLIATLL